MIPDDQVGVAIVNLWHDGPAAPLPMGEPQLDVATSAHEGGHCPLQVLRLLLGCGGGGGGGGLGSGGGRCRGGLVAG